ncbi:hypothetical protein JF770_04085 [Mycobacterium intracellulare]|uniref:hypothetical protein n=1 Tax=Mycobacterium intracellulare TaxID=1767 RepID=UPI001CD9AA1B|nr:hypothetical protein [Mycobacterium intracellulare]MCA2302727.1 hypothetical protein [Mycobacterium intracellulare]MCA2344484.1 hypothetical protein [Mycobacterium intracellulare]UGU02706.1 hypothetical protein LTS63_02785 [Mycobacterium intracellulare]
MSDADDTSRPVPAWVQAHGITDRDTGIAIARASRQLLIDAAANAFGRGQDFSTGVALLGGLVTRGIGLHDGAVAALGADNPFAAFTLIRSLAENAAALLYATDRPTTVDRVLGLDGHPLPVGKLTAYANQSPRFGAFKDVYSELSQYAHPGAKGFSASMSLSGNNFRWSGTPAFRLGNDFLMACAWIVELAGANSHFIVEFADSQGW